MNSWSIYTLLILGITLVAKGMSLMDPNSRAITSVDEVTGLRMDLLLTLAMGLEGFVIVGLIVSLLLKCLRGGFVLILAYSTLILSYRLIAVLIGAKRCACLGNISDWWPWLGRNEAPILSAIALWLFLTSAMQLFSRSRTKVVHPVQVN